MARNLHNIPGGGAGSFENIRMILELPIEFWFVGIGALAPVAGTSVTGVAWCIVLNETRRIKAIA